MISITPLPRSIRFWTNHMKDTENDWAELKQISGLAADNLEDAFREMQCEAAVLPRLKNFFYHADFNPCPNGRELAEDESERTYEIFERHRGIPEGTPRIVFEHVKNGRGESPGGVSPPGARRTVQERLRSYGSHHPAVGLRPRRSQ